MSWQLIYMQQAQKDAKKIAKAGYKTAVEKLLTILNHNPFQNPPPYEKLLGDLCGAFSLRITIQHRLIYQVIKPQKIVKILRMWTHYQ